MPAPHNELPLFLAPCIAAAPAPEVEAMRCPFWLGLLGALCRPSTTGAPAAAGRGAATKVPTASALPPTDAGVGVPCLVRAAATPGSSGDPEAAVAATGEGTVLVAWGTRGRLSLAGLLKFAWACVDAAAEDPVLADTLAEGQPIGEARAPRLPPAAEAAGREIVVVVVGAAAAAAGAFGGGGGRPGLEGSGPCTMDRRGEKMVAPAMERFSILGRDVALGLDNRGPATAGKGSTKEGTDI